MHTKYYSNTRIPNKFHLQVKNIKQSLTQRTGSEEIDKIKKEKKINLLMNEQMHKYIE